MSRTVIRFTREGLEGRVTGYKEVTVPAHSINAKNSTSLLRKPATKADFVRGKAGFFPFSPGGIDIGNANERAEGLELQEALVEERIGRDGLLQIAPGLSRGLNFKEEEEAKGEQIDVEEEGFKFGDVAPKRRHKQESADGTKGEAEKPLAELDSIDDLLPIEVRFLYLKSCFMLLITIIVSNVGTKRSFALGIDKAKNERMGTHGRCEQRAYKFPGAGT